MKLRQTHSIPAAAAKAGFSAATGYRIAHEPVPPSQRGAPRGRRRPDPIADIFESEVVPLLKAAPGLRAVAIYEEMRRRHPDLDPGVRRMFDRLIEAMPERDACRLMVELLSMAHERACEAELADLLAQDLDAGRLPDIDALRARFAPDPASLPEVIVELVPLSDYNALLMGEAA